MLKMAVVQCYKFALTMVNIASEMEYRAVVYRILLIK